MNRIDAGDVPFVKIALIGDSGVGKSTLSTVLATGCFETSPIYRPTIGCVIQVLHSTHHVQGKYFVELWDLGGNPRFSDARPICYKDCDGYIFLWDSSSEVTYHSLQTWLEEVSEARKRRDDFTPHGKYFKNESFEKYNQNNNQNNTHNKNDKNNRNGNNDRDDNNENIESTDLYGLEGGDIRGDSSDNRGDIRGDRKESRGESRGEYRGENNYSSGSFQNMNDNINNIHNINMMNNDISYSNDSDSDNNSLPLLIVGNKIDKLNAAEKVALQTACAQQVFVSSRSPDDYDPKPFFQFFDEVYDKTRARQQDGNTRRKSIFVALSSGDRLRTNNRNNPNNLESSTQDPTQYPTHDPHTTPIKAPKNGEGKNGTVASNENTGNNNNGNSSSNINDNNNNNSNNNNNNNNNSNNENNDGTELHWTSPLRGFTSSLFSLSSSASSLRYRTTTHAPEKGVKYPATVDLEKV